MPDTPGSAATPPHRWEEIIHALETGTTGFEKAWVMPLFDYLAQHPDEASSCSEGATGHGQAGAAPGQEHTAAEYAALVGKAGFRLSRAVPMESVVSVVEGLPI